MENQMDAIINQLSHIEDTAVRIMESADHQKTELALKMEQQTKEYDAELSVTTNEQLNALKEKLNMEKESALSALRQETEQALGKLENDYTANHAVWAQEILESMIRE